MKRCLLFILLIIYVDFGGNAQSPPAYKEVLHRAEQFYTSDNPTQHTDSLAFQLYAQAIDLLEKDHANDSLLIDSYTKAAILKQMKGDDSIAIDLFKRALKVADNNRSLSDSVRFFPLLYCGSSYYTLYQFDSASRYYQLAENITEKFPHVPERERLYNKIGTLYYEEGNFHQSLNYFTKALSLLDTTDAANNFLLVNYYNNIAITYRKLGRYEEALNTYRLLLPYHINEDGLMHNIATIYLDLQQPQKALQYLHAVKKPGQQQYNNFALAHLQLDHRDSVSFYLQKAFGSRIHSFKTAVNGLSWYYLGRLQEQQEKYDEALKTFHRAIIEMDPDFNNPNPASNPTQFNGMHSFSDLFNAITAKANIQRKLYAATKQVLFLEQSLQTWETALLLARTVQQGYEADESRLFLNRNLQPVSEQAAETALELYETKHDKRTLEKIFELAETSKAAVLQIRLKQSSAATLPGMPVDLLEKQKTQQILLGRLQVQYERATDTAMLANLQQQIRDQEILLSEVNQQLNHDPKYAAARSTYATLDIEALKKEMPENMGMLSYYLINDRWLAFALAKNDLFLEVLQQNAPVTQALNVVRSQLSSAALSASQLVAPMATLHQWCIKPLLGHLKGIERLVIIPDHDLQYLPFEILAPENGQTLQEEFAISYNYSAVFFSMYVLRTGFAQKELGVAPFGQRILISPGNFTQLPASLEEINAIKGDKLDGSYATKEAFLKIAPLYTSIHLATHAVANDHEPQNSFIAFYPFGSETDYKLYQPEIYNLDLRQAQLVILSACETGRGQFVHGEGMMSLARAFSYAGCKSVITSLWKADDKSTAYITKQLHHYLQSGKTKDIALQQAKLDYLHDKSIPQREKTPAYWAHLVLIGDVEPLYAPSMNIWWIVAGAVIIGGIAIAMLRKSK